MGARARGLSVRAVSAATSCSSLICQRQHWRELYSVFGRHLRVFPLLLPAGMLRLCAWSFSAFSVGSLLRQHGHCCCSEERAVSIWPKSNPVTGVRGDAAWRLCIKGQTIWGRLREVSGSSLGALWIQRTVCHCYWRRYAAVSGAAVQ